MIEEKQSLQEVPCPRCAAEATWRFIDDEETRVEVVCPDCGRFELPRADFERSESDILEPEQPRE